MRVDKYVSPICRVWDMFCRFNDHSNPFNDQSFEGTTRIQVSYQDPPVRVILAGLPKQGTCMPARLPFNNVTD